MILPSPGAEEGSPQLHCRGCDPLQPQTLRVLSAAPLGLPALLPSQPFLFRRVSIQLVLGRGAKLESAKELSRMFLPDMMSSPKPS